LKHLKLLIERVLLSRVASQVVDGIAITSFLYIGGIPDDDEEANAFIEHNQLRQKITHSQ